MGVWGFYARLGVYASIEPNVGFVATQSGVRAARNGPRVVSMDVDTSNLFVVKDEEQEARMVMGDNIFILRE